MHWSLRSWNISEREYPEKHQTKQANEDDEQEDWAQKETFSVEVCQRWNRGDKVQLEDESGFRLCCELVILCTGKAAPLGKRAISPVTRWGEGKDSPKAKRVQINTSQDQGNHCVWNPRTSRWKLNPIVKAHVVSQIVTETVRGACGHRDESNRCANA